MRPECNFFQFEENAHGGASAIGQFVSSDSKGGGSFGGMGGGGGHGGGAGYGQVPVDSVTFLFHFCVIRGFTIYTQVLLSFILCTMSVKGCDPWNWVTFRSILATFEASNTSGAIGSLAKNTTGKKVTIAGTLCIIVGFAIFIL